MFIKENRFKKISHMNFLKTFHRDMKPCDTKRASDNPKKWDDIET